MLGRITVRRAYYHCDGVQAWDRAPRRRTRRRRRVAVAGPALDGGPRRGRRAVRHRRRPARRAGRNPIVHQTDRTLSRDRRRRRRRSASPPKSPAIAHRRVGVLPAPAGSGATPPDKLYIAIDGTGVPGGGRGRRPGRQERRRPGPHPRGQTRLPVHPDRARRAGPPGARHRLHQLPGQLRARRRVRHPGARRSPPPRRRPTSANSSCSATVRPGSGTWPPRSHPRPPRSWTSTTPANTCTSSPPRSRPPSATSTPTGWPQGWPTSMPATSKPSSPKPPASRLRGTSPTRP